MTSTSRLCCCRLRISRRILLDYGGKLGLAEPGAAMGALARAVASSPAWDSAPGAAVILRLEPVPLLAVIGRFDQTGNAWLRAQAQALARDCTRLRVVTYSQAEDDCQRLASELVACVGRDQLRRARFVAIPRGGLVVLGLLATALGLEREQLEPPHSPELPLVVVDDCALSGARFGSFLRQHGHDSTVIFAHLYSHPELRTAIETREPRVVACLSARDLRSDQVLDLEVARNRFLRHMEGAYWIGNTEILAFPWGEADHLVWHPEAKRPVLAWRLVPPELCLKNRVRQPIPVQVQPAATGPLQPGRDVIFGELEGRIVLHQLSRGESASLDPVASDIWRAIIRLGDIAEVTAELVQAYAVSEQRLQREAADLVQELVDQGFLERRQASRHRRAGR